MVVGALIFVLGIDLVKEALWDTRSRVNRWEYITIASIMICMTVWDFVIGVIFGIVMSCMSSAIPFCEVCIADYGLFRYLLRDTELSGQVHTRTAYGRIGHVHCASSECA